MSWQTRAKGWCVFIGELAFMFGVGYLIVKYGAA
jgi:hypothetical protein